MTAKKNISKEFITTKDLADRWGIGTGTLKSWRSFDEGPAYIRLGARVVYKVSDIENFEKQNKTHPEN